MQNQRRQLNQAVYQLRTAFDRTSSLTEQARIFREKRLELIRTGRIWRPMMPGPICAVHFIPLSAVAYRQQVDIRKLYDEGELSYSFSFDDWGGASRTFNFDGLVIHPGQAATVKFTAYDFGVYGGLEAVVENISPDTVSG